VDLLMGGTLNSYGGGLVGDTIEGVVWNGGEIAFFNGFHALNIIGEYDHRPTGRLVMRMGTDLLQTASDRLVVTGDAILEGGGLTVTASGILPEDSTWTIISTTTGLSGSFNEFLVTLPPGVELDYTPYTVNLVT
jgi:hypothetical protein